MFSVFFCVDKTYKCRIIVIFSIAASRVERSGRREETLRLRLRCQLFWVRQAAPGRGVTTGSLSVTNKRPFADCEARGEMETCDQWEPRIDMQWPIRGRQRDDNEYRCRVMMTVVCHVNNVKVKNKGYWTEHQSACVFMCVLWPLLYTSILNKISMDVFRSIRDCNM